MKTPNPHLRLEGGDADLAISNIVHHLDYLLTDQQKAQINWHDEQSVALAVMRIISDLNRVPPR